LFPKKKKKERWLCKAMEDKNDDKITVVKRGRDKKKKEGNSKEEEK